MKRVLQIHVFIALSMLLFVACKKENMGDCFKSVGHQTQQVRPLGEFDIVVIEKDVDVTFVPDTANYAIVRCGDNLIDLIITDVEDGQLTISNHNKCNWVRKFDTPIKAEVHLKQMKALYFKGSGQITNIDTLRSENLLIDMYDASGDVNLTVKNGWNVIAQHTGNADIKLSGIVPANTMFSGGNGFLDCRNLITPVSYVRHSGTGDFKVYANSELDVRIELIGNVYYTGNPAVINQTITGTGKLIQE